MTYFYIICWYYNIHEDKGVLDILIKIPYISMQYSIE